MDASKKVIVAQGFSLNAKIVYKSPRVSDGSCGDQKEKGKRDEIGNGYGPLNAVLLNQELVCSLRDI